MLFGIGLMFFIIGKFTHMSIMFTRVNTYEKKFSLTEESSICTYVLFLTFVPFLEKYKKAAGTGNSDGLKNPLPSVSCLTTDHRRKPTNSPTFCAGRVFCIQLMQPTTSLQYVLFGAKVNITPISQKQNTSTTCRNHWSKFNDYDKKYFPK